MATHLGLSPETSASYERFLACVHPDDREEVERIHQRTLAEKTVYRTEYRTIWPDGSIHWLLTRGRCIKDLRGKPIHLLGAATDMTELKQAEEAVLESEARFRRLMDANIIGIALVHLEGPILEANDALLSLLGYTQEDVAAGGSSGRR